MHKEQQSCLVQDKVHCLVDNTRMANWPIVTEPRNLASCPAVAHSRRLLQPSRSLSSDTTNLIYKISNLTDVVIITYKALAKDML